MVGVDGEIHAGEGRAEQEYERQNDNVERGKSVDVEPLLGCRHNASAGQHRGPQICREHAFRHGHAKDRRQYLPRQQEQKAEPRPGNRKDQHRDDRLFGEHGVPQPFNALRRSTSIEPNSRLM